MNGANFRSVADGQFECQGENRLALFVCDDKGLVVSRSSKTGLFPHDLASALRGFLAYLVQVIKLNASLIEHCLACVFDVKEVTWHRQPPAFRTEFSIATGHARTGVGHVGCGKTAGAGALPKLKTRHPGQSCEDRALPALGSKSGGVP